MDTTTSQYRCWETNAQTHATKLGNGTQCQDTAGTLFIKKDQAAKHLFEHASTKRQSLDSALGDRVSISLVQARRTLSLLFARCCWTSFQGKCFLLSTTKQSSILDCVSDICQGVAKLGADNKISSSSKQRRASKDERDWIDVDKLNEHDPQACSAYAEAVMETLREGELLKKPNSRYLEQVQPDVNAKMRAILVDWLVEVSEEYKLCADTLYQAVNYIDRYLSTQVAQRNQLQLIGVTCMWLSAKYEEIYPPNVADFCYITDNTYARDQLIQMEEVVLKKLNYELTVPTAKTFLRRLLQVCSPDKLLHFLSNYLTELSLLDYGMLVFLPSVVAAAGVYLANLMLQRQPWDANLRHYSGCAPGEVKLCVIALASVHQAVSSSQQLPAIRDKYGHPRYQQVSKIPPISVSTCVFS